jgi:gamma-glutamylaminecyclotransferase
LIRIFVYGTLKAGFPNAHINRGVRVPGTFRTVKRLALYVVGTHHVPWLVEPSSSDTGLQVQGELYALQDVDLPRMDALEGIGRPGGYRRVLIQVQRVLDDGTLGTPEDASVYLQDMGHLGGQVLHAGPLLAYTAAHAAHYRLATLNPTNPGAQETP